LFAGLKVWKGPFAGLKVDRLEGWEKTKKGGQKSGRRVQGEGEFQNGKGERAGSLSSRSMVPRF
jgi:hypothetical protein